MRKQLRLKALHIRGIIVDIFTFQLFWAPLAALVVGVLITAAISFSFYQREVRSERSDLDRVAKDITNQVDLLLANGMLRVQSLEETLEKRPLDYRKHEINYFKEALPHTVFQRLTIFLDRNPQSEDHQKKDMKVILRYTISGSSLPEAATDYLQSEDIYKTIREMKVESTPIRVLLFDRGAGPRLSVILRSRLHNNFYFVFTTPIEALFKNIDIQDLDSIQVASTTGEKMWKLKSIDGSKQVIFETEKVKPSSLFYQIHADEVLPQSGLAIDMVFNFSKKHITWLSASNIAAITGIFLSITIAFIFYLLITETKRSDRLLYLRTQDLERTASDLKEALEIKTRFLGKVSHEIRTPLNLILGMIDLCEEKDISKNCESYLKSMKASGEHLLNMIDDLIVLAKQQSAPVTLQQKSFFLVPRVSEILKLISQEAHKKGLKLYLQIDPNLPATIECDPRRLRQVLFNLLKNSVKYTDTGYIKLRVSSLDKKYDSVSKKYNQKIKFEIIDTGRGIEKEKLARIFEAFYQVDEEKIAQEGGAGLGLAIVKELVNKMNGSINVNSTYGRGSCFSVSFNFDIINQQPWFEFFQKNQNEFRNLALVTNNEHIKCSFGAIKQDRRFNFQLIELSEFNKWFISHKDNLDLIILDFSDDLQSEEMKKVLGQLSTVVPKKKIIVLTDGTSSNLQLEENYISKILTPASSLDLYYVMGYSLDQADKLNSKDGFFADMGPSVDVQQKKLSLLVADDDVGNLELYKAYFSGNKWNTIYVENGQLAFDSYKSERPDLAIIDLRMPVLDGLATIEKIREFEATNKSKPIPILLVTADLFEQTTKKAEIYENVFVMTKPIRKVQLLSAINEKINLNQN